MSRLSKRAWYERVNATWPEQVPPLTAQEAVSAAKRLYRFVKGHRLTNPVRVTSGNRYSGFRWDDSGKVHRYVLCVNPDRGWHSLVHSLSHHFKPGAHGREHAIVERRMITEVVRRGWLEGKLKHDPKPEPPRDQRAERYRRIMARIERWEQKKRRAENALRRLNRTRRYYERVLGEAA